MKKILSIALLLVSSLATFSTDLGLMWDFNSEPNISTYKVYYGSSSRTYTNVTVVGKTNVWLIPTNIPIGVLKYYAVTAVNSNALESDFSVEVAFAKTNMPPSKPTGLQVIEIKPN